MGLYKIEIKTATGTSTASVEQFLELSLDARLKLILERSVRFFDENGELPAKEGMRLLREVRAGGAAPAPAANQWAPATLVLKDFVALPLDERLRIVMDRRVRIHDEQGAEIALTVALRLAREGSSRR